MNVLVTGGAGYIGSHAVRGLIESGHRVVVVDNLSTGYEAAVDGRSVFYKGSLQDKAFLMSVFQQEAIEGVIHFAAKSLVGESMLKPLLYFDNNVYGTQVLLEVMQASGVDKIVFSSTAAVYGEPVAIPIVESHPTEPINPYGASKLMMEKMMHWSSLAFGLRYVSLRYFNVAGAHASGSLGEAHNPETHLIPIVLQVPLGKRRQMSLYGSDYATSDGTCIRDYIHIDDLVRAHILALEKLAEGMSSQVINLGSGNGFSNLEIVEAARKVTGHAIPVVFEARRPGDPAVLIASNEKAKEVLGWVPERDDLSSIIGSAWRFHSLNPNGYEVNHD